MAKKKIHVEYSMEKELTDEIGLILAENPRFFEMKEKLVIAACYLVRMDDDGESQPGKGKHIVIKKVAPEMQVLMKTKPHFVLVVDYHWWGEASPSERRGNVTKILSRVRFEESEEGIKTGMEKWDVEEMFSNLEFSGVYDETTLRLKEIMGKANSRMLDAAAHGISKATPEPKAAAKAPPAAEPEEPEAEDEPPRVVARAVPKASPLAKKKTDEEPPVRPARKIPADPVEPEPEPEDPEPED